MFQDLAGNTRAQAFSFGSPTTATVRNKVRTAFVGSSDPVDFYRFDLLRSSSINLSLRNRDSGNADLQLLNRAGKVLFSSQKGASERDAIATTLASGTFYVRVFPSQGDVTYRLILRIRQDFSA